MLGVSYCPFGNGSEATAKCGLLLRSIAWRRRVPAGRPARCNQPLQHARLVTFRYNHVRRTRRARVKWTMTTRQAPARILVVDDDVRLRDLLSQYLAEQGF